MTWLHYLTIFALSTSASASLFIPGHTCQCPQFACQPAGPTTCPAFLCPAPKPCSGTGYVAPVPAPPSPQIAFSAQNYPPQLYAQPRALDDLELRAAASGIRLGQPTQNPETAQLKVLERLGEDMGKGEDWDLASGLRKPEDIRRAPTSAITVREVPEGDDPKAEKPQEETTPASTQTQNGSELPKCNSQVLKKLMEENMSDNSSDSKRQINTAAEAKFGGNLFSLGMQLFVCAIDGAVHGLDVTPETTIRDLKQRLCANDETILSYGSGILEDEQTIAGLELTNGATLAINHRLLGGKVHGSLARAGKVRSQTPKVEKQEKKKKKVGRAHRRIQYNRRYVNVAVGGIGRKRGPNTQNV
ncbi:unnamed protein product, partial [Mesorhabditis spiculigera]